MASDFQVRGENDDAPFTLLIYRGEGVALLAMNWRADARPPDDLVGFAIEFRTEGETRWQTVPNRLSFTLPPPGHDEEQLSSTEAPIQKFRWVHFPPNAMSHGEKTRYRVTPIFMDEHDALSARPAQEATIDLGSETYPGVLNVAFTRGFVSSQAFVHRYTKHGEKLSTLIPGAANQGLKFEPTHPMAQEAYAWMGFEARAAILAVLDEAIADADAQVRIVAYDFNLPELVTRIEQLGVRARVIIDNSKDHRVTDSAENAAEQRLVASAGRDQVKRQHMGNLQHNKMIVVEGPKSKVVVWGSTNFSWRGFFVQNNNALIVRGDHAVQLGAQAFDAYWDSNGDLKTFESSPVTKLAPLMIDEVNAQVTFSPHGDDTAELDAIGRDIGKATSSVLYSLAFLAQTSGAVTEALTAATNDDAIFVYGIADAPDDKIALHTNSGGNLPPVSPVALSDKDVPEPFRSEPTGGGGIRMHHKFVVLDFDQPSARVWLGSYNFSQVADLSNGENLVLINDARVATSYMVEALRIFDHYRFRVARRDAESKGDPLLLRRPPRTTDDVPWFDEDYTDPVKVRDRKLFAG